MIVVCGLSSMTACVRESSLPPTLVPAPPLPTAGRVFDLTRSVVGTGLLEGPRTTRAWSPTGDERDPGRLIGPAVIIDLPSGEVDAVVRVEQLLAWESVHGPITSGSWVVARSLHVEDSGDESSPSHHPGWSVEAVRFLIRERSISGVGIDAPAIDPGIAGEPMAREALRAGRRWAIESLTGLDALPSHGATLVVAPLPVSDRAMAPASVLAVVPR